MGKKAIKRRKLNAKKDDNIDDKIIKSLEKKLRLKNKKKPSKSLPKSFVCDGLDYILEVCDEDTRKIAAESEKQLTVQSDDEFDIFTDDSDVDSPVQSGVKKNTVTSNKVKKFESKESSLESILELECDSENQSEFDDSDETSNSKKSKKNSLQKKAKSCKSKKSSSFEDGLENISGSKKKKELKRNVKDSKSHRVVPLKKQKTSDDYSGDDADSDVPIDESDIGSNHNSDLEEDDSVIRTKEDIYGREITEDGKIIPKSKEKYVSPALRAKNLDNSSEKKEKLLFLKRQIKGLLNRLAESNMHSIVSQVIFFKKVFFRKRSI